MSYHILLYIITSYHTIPYLISYYIIYHIISYHIISYIVSCLDNYISQKTMVTIFYQLSQLITVSKRWSCSKTKVLDQLTESYDFIQPNKTPKFYNSVFSNELLQPILAVGMCDCVTGWQKSQFTQGDGDVISWWKSHNGVDKSVEIMCCLNGDWSIVLRLLRWLNGNDKPSSTRSVIQCNNVILATFEP